MRASAIVVSPGADRQGQALVELARGLAFDAVLPFTGVRDAQLQATRTPLLFFLCVCDDAMRGLAAVAEAIRFNPSAAVRFSPLVYFAENPSLAHIRRCIGLGFDDVITRPFSRERVESRLRRQIEETQVYFETATYFGPDRRNRAGNEVAHPDRGRGGQFRRLEIRRTPTAGIQVLRDDIHIP